jgi:hypothetical protein
MLADGGEAISDPAVLRNQPDLFGSVASDPTAWRVLAGLDDEALAGLQATSRAREVAWAQAAETDRLPSRRGRRGQLLNQQGQPVERRMNYGIES